ncbi:MAG: lipase chaperone [Moraxellaceae bacterium]|nr:MAG: lipase chaperone [Moraxellaceae bacterium]
MKKTHITLVGLIGLLLIAVIIIIFWLKPDTSPALSDQQSDQKSSQATGATLNSPSTSSTQIPPSDQQSPTAQALAASLQGTQIDCALEANGAGQLILDMNIRRCFEYFLTQMGEKQLSDIDQQVRQHLTAILPATAATQAIDLWQRYLKYRAAEAKINVSSSPNDPAHLQHVFDALYQLRQRYFSRPELDALFGDEMTYNQYTIDRVNIMQDSSLSATQKAQQLKQRFAQLPADLQKNLQDMNKLNDLRELTQQIKQQHGSKAELQQMRQQLVGTAAAERLEQLDQSRANWQNRVDDYLSQRNAILSSKQADEDKQVAIAALRQRQFASEPERQRAITYEHLTDQNVDTAALLNP